MSDNNTKKREKVEAVLTYCRYAQEKIADGLYTRAQKGDGINRGAVGNAFEMSVKLALDNYRFKGVAPARRSDTTKKAVDGTIDKIECKSGLGGEFAILNQYGEVIGGIYNSDYTIFCPYPDPDFFDSIEKLSKICLVLRSSDFFYALNESGLLRQKMTTAMHRNEFIPKELKYKDRLSLQVNSNKKLNLLWDILDAQGIPFDEFLQERYIIK